MLVICDIDGTVANNDHRAHLVEPEDGSRPTDEMWAKFMAPELIVQDTPIPGAYSTLSNLIEHNENLQLVWLTGRGGTLHEPTFQWLAKHFPDLMPHSFLITRPEEHEHTKAVVYKTAMIEKLMENIVWKTQTKLAFDDDRYLWPVYKKYGMLALRAPHCWEHLYPESGELLPEDSWRR